MSLFLNFLSGPGGQGLMPAASTTTSSFSATAAAASVTTTPPPFFPPPRRPRVCPPPRHRLCDLHHLCGHHDDHHDRHPFFPFCHLHRSCLRRNSDSGLSSPVLPLYRSIP